jgi:hypothetical protein
MGKMLGRAQQGTSFDPPGRIAIFVRFSFTIVNYLHSIVKGDGSFVEHLIDPITGISFGDASIPGLNSGFGLHDALSNFFDTGGKDRLSVCLYPI